mmetsp:Transcript_99967/g.308495  ORF Transcript_99967/g.308495 Transcript_99967/m.308495 type:complete len:205 (-) Transcript_99967:591-1205(-)
MYLSVRVHELALRPALKDADSAFRVHPPQDPHLLRSPILAGIVWVLRRAVSRSGSRARSHNPTPSRSSLVLNFLLISMHADVNWRSACSSTDANWHAWKFPLTQSSMNSRSPRSCGGAFSSTRASSLHAARTNWGVEKSSLAASVNATRSGLWPLTSASAAQSTISPSARNSSGASSISPPSCLTAAAKTSRSLSISAGASFSA